VTGTVLDASFGDPVPGATVIVKGTTRGVATDLDGKFSIDLQSGDQILVISFVGYVTQEVEIGNQSTFTINLEEDIQSLQEAVVIGYGSQDKKEITSAVVGVKPEDFNKGNVSNPAQLLQGKVAGLSITRPGNNPNAGFNIRLRGLSTFGANSSPLIVLDGVIGASLENVDPNDIQSIDVLKDGSAAAIYGARGSSGVILITTTKKGNKDGRSEVNINAFGTLDKASNLIPVLSPEEFVARGGTDFGSRTNWREELLRDAYSYTTNASVSGGFNNTNYLASVNYRNNNGVINGISNERLNTRVNLSQGALNNKLRFNVNLSFTTVESNSVPEAAFRYATIYNPTAPIFEDTETANERFGGYFQRDLFDFFNPVALINQQKGINEIKTALTSYRVEYDFLPNLTISAQYSEDRRNELIGNFWSIQDFQVGFGARGSAERITNDRYQRIFESTLRYEVDITDKLNLTLLGGVGTQTTKNQGFGARSRQFLFDTGWDNIGAGALRVGNFTNMYSYANEDQLNSVFGRANFNYNNTFFFSASVRAETYSGFGEENQTGVFPAFSVGSDFTQIFNMGVFSQFKPRVSYGVTGNLPPSPTLALGVFGNGNRIDLDGDPLSTDDIYVGIIQNSNPNRFLKWETKKEFNVGVDFGIWNNKVTGSMDYYTRNISDLLFNVPVGGGPNIFDPGRFNTVGSTWVNLADLSNAGFEFAAAVNGLNLGEVVWTPSANFTIYKKTQIESLSASGLGFDELRFATPGSPGQNNNPIIYNRVGQTLGDIYGPRLEGLTDGGEYILSTTDPDEFERLGNGLPKGEFGFSNSFVWRQFSLNFFLRGVWGHDLYNSYRGFYENADGASGTWNSVITDKTSTNPLVTSTPTFNSSYVEDASFIRLDNMELGYNFKTNSPNIGSFRVYFAAQNLFTITNYTGIDPEARVTDSENNDSFTSALSPGIERRNSYFQTRSFTLGLSLNFK
jgi:iron complex outermembrane receptor protein